MGRHRNARIIISPAAMRAAARRGEWRGSTGGQCPAYQQANLVILLLVNHRRRCRPMGDEDSSTIFRV